MHGESLPIIDQLNQTTMRTPEAVARYARNQEIWPAEQVLWDRIRGEAQGKPILDLGVGGGRTVEPLLTISRDYVGLDYTPKMVETCKRKYPGVRFEFGDARDLSRFPDESFFLVTFTCNGLGMVGHEDRMQILREVRRVLWRGGAFLFSNHNQDSPDHRRGMQLPPLELSPNPLRMALRMWRFARTSAVRAYNHRRYSKHDRRSPEYSVINDLCHDYATMIYYVSLRNMRRQLESVGFLPGAEAYDLSGRLIGADTSDSCISYLARK